MTQLFSHTAENLHILSLLRQGALSVCVALSGLFSLRPITPRLGDNHATTFYSMGPAQICAGSRPNESQSLPLGPTEVIVKRLCLNKERGRGSEQDSASKNERMWDTLQTPSVALGGSINKNGRK